MKTMKSLESITNNFNPKNLAQVTEKRVVPDQAALVVNQLFLDLKAIFPAWRSAFPSKQIEQQSKVEWIKSFVENGIGQTEQLKIGLQKARSYGEPWFPSCGQFIKWCKPCLEDYGLPSAEQALRDVIDGKKRSHPVLYAAAKQTGTSNLKKMHHSDLLKLFTRNYEIVCQKFINGEDFSQVIPKALPEKVYVVSSQEKRNEVAAGLREILKKGKDQCL